MLNVWNGTQWVSDDMPLVWDGTAWKHRKPSYFDPDLDWQPQTPLSGNYSVGLTVVRNIAAPSSPRPPVKPPLQTYSGSMSFQSTWYTAYQQNGTAKRFPGLADTNLYQGYYDGVYGQQVGMAGFSFGGFPAGAKATACTLTLFANHWYNGNGGVAQIGTHTNASSPATATGMSERRIKYAWDTQSGARTIDLGAGIGQEIIDGSTKGIVLGRAPDNSRNYYGYFAAAGGYRPLIGISYRWTA